VAADDQAIIEGFLGNQPSSAQLREWRETLMARARRLRQEMGEAAPAQAASLKSRLTELERQIAALEQEEMITEFVEDSVRVTLAMGAVSEGEPVEE
jgi:hypothetical protein